MVSFKRHSMITFFPFHNGIALNMRKYIKEFPKSVHLFDKSRGLKHPQPEEMTHEEFENRVKGLTPTFSRAYAVIVEADDRNIPVNYLYYEEYNLRRNK